MGTSLSRIPGTGDAELISAVRGGDVEAYGELFARHVEAARRLGRQLVSGPDVDDLVSEAFAKVLAVLQRGGGPDLAFRAYLLTAVRRLHVDRIRSASRLHTTDDLTPFDPGVPFRDTAVEGFENDTAARAFASLPERWQLVLWHTEVEGQKPADIGPLLQMSANSVSALAYRAREGLRQAFVSLHAQAALEDTECAWTHEHLGAHIRTGNSRRDAQRLEKHLGECRSCLAIHLELTEVNARLAGVLAPLLLGSAGATYAAAHSGAAATGGIASLVGRLRDLALAHTPTAVAAGAAATAVVAGSVLVVVDRHPDPAPVTTSPGAARGVGSGVGSGATTSDTSGATSGATSGVGRDRPGAPDHAGASTDPGASLRADPASADPSWGVGSDVPPSGEVGTAPSSPWAQVTPSPLSPSTSGLPLADPTHPTDPSAEVTAGSGAPDLSVSASPRRGNGNAHRVVVRVAGLSGGSATLDVASDHPSAVVTDAGGCTPVTGGHGSCHVSNTPTSYTFLVAVPEREPVTVTFTVAPDGASDAAPGDNRASVVLTP